MVRDVKFYQVMTAGVAALLMCRMPASATRLAPSDVRTNGALTSIAVRPNIYIVAGAGGNVGAHIGDDGVILIEAGRAEAADALLQAIRRLTDKPILYIINLSADSDHVGGNAVLSAAGQALVGPAAGPPRREGIPGLQRATVLAEECVLRVRLRQNRAKRVGSIDIEDRAGRKLRRRSPAEAEYVLEKAMPRSDTAGVGRSGLTCDGFERSRLSCA